MTETPEMTEIPEISENEISEKSADLMT